MKCLLHFLIGAVLASCAYAAEESSGAGSGTSGKTQIPIIVVSEGAPIFSAPTSAGVVVGKAAFGSNYVLADSAEKEPGRKCHLAVGQDMKVVGWFREEDVLLTQQPEKEAPGFYRKAFVVNEWKTMTAGTEITGASALDGPGTNGTTPYRPLRELGLFRVYFVYKRSKTQDGREYFLLGLKPQIDSVSKARDTLTGWVEGDRIQQWDTRQALQFQKDTLEKRIAGLSASIKAEGGGGASIFETEKELRAFLKGETKVGEESLTPVVSEDTRVKEQWSPTVVRYPLISAKENDLVPKAGQILQVGYISDQVFAGEAPAKDKPESGGTAEQSAKFKDIVTKMQAMDIAFVVDTTGSMEPWVEATRKAVSDIGSGLEKSFDAAERPRVRYSVTCFRDYCDVPTTYLTRRLPFTDIAREVDKFLAEQTTEGGGDPPEAVFYGLDQAIAGGEKEVTPLSYKVLILVGDAGNHPVDERGYTVTGIAKRIKEAHYEFVSVETIDPERIDSMAECKLFREQTKAIRDQLGYGNKTPIETGNPAKVTEEITRRVLEYANELKVAKAAAMAINSGGGLRAVEQNCGVRVAARITGALEAKGISVDVFLEKKAQIFGRGWTTENTTVGVAQNEIVLLVDQLSLEALVGMIADVTQNPPNKSDLAAIWQRMIRLNAGAPPEELTLDQLEALRLSLPVRANILKYSLKELVNLDEKEVGEIWSRLALNKIQISAFLNERNVEFGEETTPGGARKLVVKDSGVRTVWWQGEDLKYAWIKLSELP